MLRSQRRLSKADKCMVDNMRAAGIKPAEVFKFYEQLSGGAENVPFLQKDCNNYVTSVRRKYMEINDAQTILEYLKNKQAYDPSFFYAVQLDEEDDRIVNFFWTDGQAIVDYCCFGDVVSFDTTFQTNKFDMPFAPLLGTNHHRQTIVFAGDLLYDDSAESFVWLFRTLLTAMSGKHPTTIFTDQYAAIAKAIIMVFPGTSHRLCLWHIYQNTAKHLSHVISNHPKFLADFKRCVYEGRSVSHFNDNWRNLLCAYNLGGNRWLQNLYTLREKWATIYRRDSFCADATSTQRSEGMNNVFKKAFRRKLSLSELIEQYDRCLNSLHRNELYEDYKSRHTNPILYISSLPTLRTTVESYTRNMYSEFKKEFTKIFTMACTLILLEETTCTYKVASSEYIEDEATAVFHFENMNTTCSCRMYECEGILCRHALRVLNFNNFFVLPSQYILNRWTKYAKR